MLSNAWKRDAQRVGDGEQGKPFPLTYAERVDQAYRENGFNIYVSDKISLNRSLPDIRHPNGNQDLCISFLDSDPHGSQDLNLQDKCNNSFNPPSLHLLCVTFLFLFFFNSLF